MNVDIKKAYKENIDEIAELYDSINEYLESTIDYPGWKKDIYPTREDAEKGFKEDSLYAAWCNGSIVGTVILNHEPEEGYEKVEWKTEDDYSKIFVVRTLAVHPDFLNQGIGGHLLEFSLQHGKKTGMWALRLDVYENNLPAIKLYEKHGFTFMGRQDLGYSKYGLDYFKLYERCL